MSSPRKQRALKLWLHERNKYGIGANPRRDSNGVTDQSMTVLSKFEKLPLELLDPILSLSDTSDLSRLSRANKFFAENVKRHLYTRDISLGSTQQLLCYLRTVLNRPILAESVHTLKICGWTGQGLIDRDFKSILTPEEATFVEKTANSLHLPSLERARNNRRYDGLVATLLCLVRSSLQHLDLEIQDDISEDTIKAIELLSGPTAYHARRQEIINTFRPDQNSKCISQLLRLTSPGELFPQLKHAHIRLGVACQWEPWNEKALIQSFDPLNIYPFFAIPTLEELEVTNLGLPTYHAHAVPNTGRMLDWGIPATAITYTPRRRLPIPDTFEQKLSSITTLRFHQSLLQLPLLQTFLQVCPSLKNLQVDYHIWVGYEEDRDPETPFLHDYNSHFSGLEFWTLLLPFARQLEELSLTVSYFGFELPRDEYTDLDLNTARFLQPIESLHSFSALRSLTISWIVLMGIPDDDPEIDGEQMTFDEPQSYWLNHIDAARCAVRERVPESLVELVIWDDCCGPVFFDDLWCLPEPFINDDGEVNMEDLERYVRSERMWRKLEEYVMGMTPGRSKLKKLEVVTVNKYEEEHKQLLPDPEGVESFEKLCGSVGIEFIHRLEVRNKYEGKLW
ncbi:hypothetical protein BJ508DRAFT_411839 [Ascobolus immersus RN42]|uniref:F-box domain-containing protein n=1 Tax=Ascobolus immersus RN42 TaxID=1160509 RepID=A0A3N4IMD1_ASCIM|nr:hypothetical protein BJ508DRAFT_411839 [Ascobolus immersus RN42]